MALFDAQRLIGEKLDQFVLQEPIGRGAMGLVFKAFDTILQRTVAVKLILKPYDPSATETEALKRLIREARAAGRLSHPNIVTIYSYGETDQFQYIAMEYIPGRSLARVLNEEKVLDPTRAADFADQILQALDAASREGIVHRDIKPSNIMVMEDGRVKVTDFGIARLQHFSMTQTGMILGTPHYMSPEQVSGQKVDIRSDIFSAGVVMYELVTGLRPFEADNTSAIIYKILNHQPSTPRLCNTAVPDPISKVIEKALCKDLARRYQTPAEMLADLRGARRVWSGADSATLVMRPGRKARKHGLKLQAVRFPVPADKPVERPAKVSLDTMLGREDSADLFGEPEPGQPAEALPTKAGAPARRGRLFLVLIFLGAAFVAGGWYFTSQYGKDSRAVVRHPAPDRGPARPEVSPKPEETAPPKDDAGKPPKIPDTERRDVGTPTLPPAPPAPVAPEKVPPIPEKGPSAPNRPPPVPDKAATAADKAPPVPDKAATAPEKAPDTLTPPEDHKPASSPPEKQPEQESAEQLLKKSREQPKPPETGSLSGKSSSQPAAKEKQPQGPGAGHGSSGSKGKTGNKKLPKAETKVSPVRPEPRILKEEFKPGPAPPVADKSNPAAPESQPKKPKLLLEPMR